MNMLFFVYNNHYTWLKFCNFDYNIPSEKEKKTTKEIPIHQSFIFIIRVTNEIFYIIITALVL